MVPRHQGLRHLRGDGADPAGGHRQAHPPGGAVILTIEPIPLGSPEARALIAALDAELGARYPEPGATHFRLEEAEVAEGNGVFLIARESGVPVGCAALRRLDDVTAELKRMYVTPKARGSGIGRRLLERLEAEARKLGIIRLVLETGERQAEALGLYKYAGFAVIPPFGEYVDSPLSICMAKLLD